MKQMSQVMVSVVMSVYNGEQYVEETIKSVLAQTYQNWEMIIVNDASTDRTAEILELYEKNDTRIKVLTNKTNKKLPASLNYGISNAKGKYIIRVDADDICVKTRFEKQVDFMEKHPEVTHSWGLFYEMSNGIIRNGITTFSVSYEHTKASLLLFGLVNHSGVIMKRSLFDTYAYEPEYTISEDLKLWLEILEKNKMQGMRDYVTVYRKHEGQATNEKNRMRQQEQVKKILSNHFHKIKWNISNDIFAFHMNLIYGTDMVDCETFLNWCRELIEENKKNQWCKESALKYLYLWKLDELCRNKRLTMMRALRLANRISVGSACWYMLRKIFTAFVDIYYQRKGRKELEF